MDHLPADPSGYDGIPASAGKPETTPFDYIVIGSGAGGGPLAARLAKSGMKVLVLEAGVDPGAPLRRRAGSVPEQRKVENERLVYHCPGLHGASTEPELHGQEGAARTSWAFKVRHYSDPAYPPFNQPYHYPRASALGGCTAHHAMISIYGADLDWKKIEDMTGDSSWAPGRMRGIYQRIERSENSALGGRLLYYWRWFLDWLNPGRDASAERGGSGWLDVTLTDPKLAMKDKGLMNIVLNTVFEEEGGSREQAVLRWIKRLFAGMLFRDLDLNDEETMRRKPTGVALVPIAVTRTGLRRGPRELLLETRRSLLRSGDKFAGRLSLATGIFVRRIVFDDSQGEVPRAVGVEYSEGQHQYAASPDYDKDSGSSGPSKLCFAKREIILCGGAFNSPQVLMLSGIGDEAHLRDKGVKGMAFARRGDDGTMTVQETERVVNLPGVGSNLLDRCEISVITEMAKDFESLKGVKFDPTAPVGSDPALDAWRAEGTSKPRSGIYTTNGAALAILKRSSPAIDQPDLLLFAFPAAFRGYYEGWSKELLKTEKHGNVESRRLWSWVILKAFSRNCGSVRLRSNAYHEVPEINFKYFGDCVDPKVPQWTFNEKDDDLAALQEAIRYVRKMNQQASKLLKGGDAVTAEIQPGKGRPEGSTELRDWLVEQTWGHHAAGTCRIGADPWRSQVEAIKDKGAVIDSKFRVHGVKGLRVVDASVFPSMPGYFIAVPTYMISEKAADTILYELSY